jgi:hypothetical protein
VTSTRHPTIGLGEQQLREAFEKELLQAMRTEGNAPTVHAIAHSLARIIELDHLRMAEQLQAAGVHLEQPETLPHPYALD